jgi:hypothetical protein
MRNNRDGVGVDWMSLPKRASFWLGFSAAVGLLLAITVAAVAGGKGSTATPASLVDATPSTGPLAVFAKPRAASDAIPAELEWQASDLSGQSAAIPDQLRNGRIEVEKSRLLLSNLGSTHVDLYAIPSAKGLTCSFWVRKDSTAGGCGSFTPALPVGTTRFDPDGLGEGVPVSVGGLVPNNVTQVDVIVGGESYAATLTNNAYFFEAPNSNAQPEAVRVTFDSGSTTTISLPLMPTN